MPTSDGRKDVVGHSGHPCLQLERLLERALVGQPAVAPDEDGHLAGLDEVHLLGSLPALDYHVSCVVAWLRVGVLVWQCVCLLEARLKSAVLGI